MADPKGEGLKVGFDGSLRLEFHGAKVTRMLGFSPIVIWTKRWCYSIVFPPFFAIRGQGITSSTTWRRCCANRYTVDWLAYEDVNDAHRLSVDPTMRRITGKKMDKKKAASANTMGRFETEMLSVQGNLKALSEVNGRWVERALEKTTHRHIILDMEQLSQSCPWRAGSLCLQRPFPMYLLPSPVLFQPVRRLRRCNASARQCSQRGWLEGDAAFAKPDVYEYLEEKGFLYAIRLPANEVLQAEIRHLLTRLWAVRPESLSFGLPISNIKPPVGTGLAG